MKKDILIITSYFPPEIGAASNRIYQLANGLQKNNFNISVITPLPNYPTGKIFDDYKDKFKDVRIESNFTVNRLWIYASNSKNKLLRLIAMLSYSLSLIWFFIRNKAPETVIIQSPPLLVAFTCILLLRSKKRKLILNVSDLWPIAGLELGAFKKNISYNILERIERFNYKKADLVLGQSEEILTHIKTMFPKKQTFLYRNFPDFDLPKLSLKPRDEKLKMVYAGLLGIAQGIYKLCNELDYSAIEFHIYGSGAEQANIENFIFSNPNLPIFYHGHVTRNVLHRTLIQYDIAIIPLLHRIYGSVPSKIFEYARLGLPMLYFGGGEGEGIINDFELGWVANAGDYKHLNEVLETILTKDISEEKKKTIQQTAMSEFNFKNQLHQLKRII